MIKKVKNAVKSALMQRKIEEYYAGLDEQFTAYDKWIQQKEAQTPVTLSLAKPEVIRVVEFAECGKGFRDKVEESDEQASANNSGVLDKLLVFVQDKSGIASNALTVISDFFAANPDCILAYGDEDEWNSNCTIRMNPWFKPDFSPDTLLQYLYYGNVIIVRKTAFDNVVWADTDDYLYNLYDACLQLSLPVNRGSVGHIQYVLYHANNLKRLCTESDYDNLRKMYSDRVKSDEIGNKISIVIPSKDHSDILETCLKTMKNCDDIEIIVVDNGSSGEEKQKYEELKIKYGFNYIFEPMDFNFSRMCNLGAGAAMGDFLLFLNDDIEAMSLKIDKADRQDESNWLHQMLSHAKKSHVGAVGAKLYYPDSKTIQHAGITNLRLGPVHKMQFLDDVRPYYDGRNVYDLNVLAVTGACLMVRKTVFEECGGFSEDLAVAFNDVELCFRLYKCGYYNVQCNGAVLYHHESLSRGNDESEEKQLRLQNERKKMYDMHPDLYGTDPFYHPYLNMDILDTNFSYAYEYPACEEVDISRPTMLKEGLREEWFNDCLIISFEYAGDFAAWIKHPSIEEKELYFQGYHFVIGSDNAGFKRSVLLKNVMTQEVYEVPCGEGFRPDLDVNVEDGHVSLCGFAFVIEKGSLPKGRYQVGCMATALVGRQRLCRFVNKFVEV